MKPGPEELTMAVQAFVDPLMEEIIQPEWRR